MAHEPVHVHLFRLVKHLTTTPVSYVVPISFGQRDAPIGRQRKMERRRRKTQELIDNIKRGLK